MDNRTRALVQGLYRASDVKVYINRVEDLGYHLLQFPETCGVAVKVITGAQALIYKIFCRLAYQMHQPFCLLFDPGCETVHSSIFLCMGNSVVFGLNCKSAVAYK